MILSLIFPLFVFAQNDISIWFPPTQGNEVKNEIISLINSASKSIYAAVYDINDSDIVSALLSAHKKGIDVKVVMDDVQAETEKDIVSPLNSAGILKTDNNKSSLMHNKFVVLDGSKVLTGSTNWTENCLFYNNNNSIFITSDKLAADYTTEFNEMWNGKFGSSSPANTPYPHVIVGTTDIQCYFAPEDSVEDYIVSEISSAKSYIDFATFTFTSIPISNAIMEKIQEGIKVKGIYETRQASQYCTYDNLKTAGANVIYDGNPKTMHDKFFVIDGQTVITGSYNPTKQANTENDENLLIIKNSSIAQTYEGEFNKLFSMWSNSSVSDSFTIILNPDNPYMTVNGTKQEIDPGRGTTPVIIKEWGRTVVPIRAIVEVLDGTIDWDGNIRKVTINFKDTTIELWIDNPKAKVDGKEMWIDSDNHNVKPVIQNGRTMLPLRFVAESLGCDVQWNDTAKTITIKYPKEEQATVISLKIVNIHYTTIGNDDNKNPNGEWVEIKNTGSTSVNLKGFVLQDLAQHKFIFPDFVLDTGKTVKVYSGSGTPNLNSLYWRSSSAIWNNDGDTAYLYDINGKLIDTYKYP
jgi:hypothetical protein